MAIRYRWFYVKLPLTFEASLAALSSRRFSARSPNGFLPVSEEADPIGSFRFFWRSKVPVTVLDEEGAPAVQEVETVNTVQFRLSQHDKQVYLRIENPGRSSRELLNAVELTLGFGFVAEPVLFDRGQPIGFFASLAESRLIGLKVVGAVVSEGLVARLEFASKDGMTPQEMPLLKGLKYKVDAAVYEVLFDGVKGQIAFSASGTVKISGQLASHLIGLVERDLLLLRDG